jgi:hypothetical protein
MKKLSHWVAAAALASVPLCAIAADHLESPIVSHDTAGDMPDVYAFLDPNDNTKMIIALDVHGFIVPAENSNVGPFDNNVLYRFDIENTGDAIPDMFIEVTFSNPTSRSAAQNATLHITKLDRAGQRARITRVSGLPTTPGSATAATAPAATVTTDAATGISFFAGLREDPFFFDIPAFNRFVASVLAPPVIINNTTLQRGRDSFAGYNVQMITLSVPVALVKGTGNVVGVGGTTFRSKTRATVEELRGSKVRTGNDVIKVEKFLNQIDRMGNPVINTVVIPFRVESNGLNLKDVYNKSKPADDARGKFVTDIVASLTALGTSATNIGVLAGIAVTNGDYLRVNTTIANTGAQGGVNAGAGFPNGRRPADDVIDTVLAVVSNGGITTGDSVNSNDATFLNTFPFFAPPNQPRASGTVEDNTRN